jgi:hypothetical protein
MKQTSRYGAMHCVGGVDETGGYVGKVKLETVSGPTF